MDNPLFQKTTLPNGLRVLTAPMPHTRSVAISVYVGAGSRYERDEHAGVAHYIEHLCFKGTEKRPTALEISQVIDSVGGHINAATDRELTVFYCKIAQPYFALALDVLGDLLQKPLFAEEELEKERQVIIEELAMVADSPAQLADLLLDEVMWPGQPLGRDVAGTEETVRAVNRDIALKFLRDQYVPNNTVISVAGAITHEQVLSEVTSVFGSWKRGTPGGWFPAVNGQHGPRIAVRYKSSEQAHLSLAVRGIPIHHPDRFTLSLMSVVLGEGMSSRLSLELREKLGLCYDVHSYCSFFLDAGSFTLYAGVDPSKADEALRALIVELVKLRDEGISEEELERAKALAKGRILLRMEDTRAVSDWLGTQELLAGKVRTVDEVTALIDRVTTDDAKRLATELIQPDQLNLAVVGPFRSPRRFKPLLTI